MYKNTLLLFCFLLLSSLSSLISAETPKVGKMSGGTPVVYPEWFKESFLDFRDDAEEAGEEGKHLLLFFHIADCPYCNKMLKDNFIAEENSTIIQEKFDSIHINMKGSREIVFDKDTTMTEATLSKALNVHFTPTILFMDENNNVVSRLNGYRSPREFKQVLSFVKEKAYKHTDFASYRQKYLTDSVYTLKENDRYLTESDLSTLAKQDKPLAILFEDKSCDECDRFNKEVLELSETDTILDKFNVVRLDALSNKEIIDPNGNKTTAKAWLKKENVTYRPAVFLYSEGKEIERVTGLLKSYHFQQLLNFVANKGYTKFDTWIGYLGEQSDKILKSGKDIDIWK